MGAGGSRWGAGRPGYRIKAEDASPLDIRLLRAKRATGDAHPFVWEWWMGSRSRGNVGVMLSLNEMQLIYRTRNNSADEGTQRTQSVSISRTRCNFGGEREWFECPCCPRRCAVIYFRWNHFACRRCQQVAYASQSGGPLDRLINKVRKAKARVVWPKPKGMRWQTHKALSDRAYELEMTAQRILFARSGEDFDG